MRALDLWCLVLAAHVGCDVECPKGSVTVEDGCRRVDAGADASPDDQAGSDGGFDGGCATPKTFYLDADHDGFGDDAAGTLSCGPVAGAVELGGDCNDEASAVHPGARETCNGVDDDCAGGPDDPFPCVSGTTPACTTTCGTPGTSTCPPDCSAPTCVAPPETCNYVDDDCDGDVDPDLHGFIGDDILLLADRYAHPPPRVTWDGEKFIVMVGDRVWGVDADGDVIFDNTLEEAVGAFDVAASRAEIATAFGDHEGETSQLQATSLDIVAGLPGVSSEEILAEGLIPGAVDLVEAGNDFVALFWIVSADTDSVRIRRFDPIGDPPIVLDNVINAMLPDGDLDPDREEIAVAYVASDTQEMNVLMLDDRGNRLLDPVRVTESGGGSSVTLVAIAHGRETVLAVYSQRVGDLQGPIEAVALGDDLTVMESFQVRGTGNIAADSVATSGGEYLITAIDFVGLDAGVHIYRFGPTGVPLGENAQIGGTPFNTASVVWAGDRYAIAYQFTDGGTTSTLVRQFGCAP